MQESHQDPRPYRRQEDVDHKCGLSRLKRRCSRRPSDKNRAESIASQIKKEALEENAKNEISKYIESGLQSPLLVF